ncbi:hypothetical protein D9758_004890 [Tetrapyrgos nigripes]|uniref:Protein kinase domain-containing protein n=1 Tax=Tetrapyrgos nigripes TaxID=182062 RepID=A0A8H5G5W3_9AGAR|nr:hypothetical protein D9758_004890 [Tetrapyrgos nigripes]
MMDPFFSSPFPSSKPTSTEFGTSSTLSSMKILESWTDSLTSGEWRWSQVWKGKLCPEKKKGSVKKGSRVKKGPSKPEEEKQVVIKIFQQSKFPEYYSGAEVTWKEAHAYKKMMKLQGKVIPKSFGFHKVYAPASNGRPEPCYAHVLEYLPLSSLRLLEQQARSTRLSGETVSSLLDNLVSSLHEVHECGIAHNDIINISNVLVETSTTDAEVLLVTKVVLIDFSMSVDAEPDALKNDGNSVIGLIGELHVSQRILTVLQWYERNSDKPYAKGVFANVDLNPGKKRKPRIPGEYPESFKRFRAITLGHRAELEAES